MAEPQTGETVYRWRCPLDACNQEQSGLFSDEQQVQTEFSEHIKKHSPIDFVQHMLRGKWRTRFQLTSTD